MPENDKLVTLKITVNELNIINQSLEVVTIKGSDAIFFSKLMSKVGKQLEKVTE